MKKLFKRIVLLVFTTSILFGCSNDTENEKETDKNASEQNSEETYMEEPSSNKKYTEVNKEDSSRNFEDFVDDTNKLLNEYSIEMKRQDTGLGLSIDVPVDKDNIGLYKVWKDDYFFRVKLIGESKFEIVLRDYGEMISEDDVLAFNIGEQEMYTIKSILESRFTDPSNIYEVDLTMYPSINEEVEYYIVGTGELSNDPYFVKSYDIGKKITSRHWVISNGNKVYDVFADYETAYESNVLLTEIYAMVNSITIN